MSDDKIMKIEDFGQYEIYVDDAGKFLAGVDGKVVRRASLAALKNYLKKTAQRLPVVVVGRWRFDVPGLSQDAVLGVHRPGTWGAKLVGPDGKIETNPGMVYGRSAYVDDGQIFDRLVALRDELYAEHVRLEERWQDALAGLTEVTPGNFRGVQAVWLALDDKD